MQGQQQEIKSSNALAVAGVLHKFFRLIEHIDRYNQLVERMKFLCLDPENQKYLEHFTKEKLGSFRSDSHGTFIMSKGILEDTKYADFYKELKECFVEEYGNFWGQIKMNIFFLEFATRKIFIRTKIENLISEISPLKDGKIPKLYFLNIGAGLDNTIFFVGQVCKFHGIDCELIELDIPEMSSFKQNLIKLYTSSLTSSLTFVPCNISDDPKKIGEAFKPLKEKLEKDKGKDICLITLSEGLTMYIDFAKMQDFNQYLLDLFKSYGVKIFSITDSLVCEKKHLDSCSTLDKEFIRLPSLNCAVENEEEFKERYCPDRPVSKISYEVYYPTTEIDISREYTAVMMLICLESKFIEDETATNPKFSKLHELEREIRKIYEDKKKDPSFVQAVEVLDKIELGDKTDMQIVAEFCENFSERTEQNFLDTNCAKFLLELSNACRSSVFLWNMTLAPKCEKDPPKRTPDDVWKTNCQTFVERYKQHCGSEKEDGGRLL